MAALFATLLLCVLFVGVVHSHELEEHSQSCTACALTALPDDALQADGGDYTLVLSGRSWTAPELPISLEAAAPSRSRAPPVSH